MKVFLCIVSITVCYAFNSKWDDPHEMISDTKRKPQKKIKLESSELGVITNLQPLDLNLFNIHFKRIISLIMNAANIDKSDPLLFHGYLMFDITPADFKYLKDLSNEELNIHSLRKVDTIFSETFSKTPVESFLEDIMKIESKLYAFIVNIHTFWLVGTCFMLYIVYQLFRTNFSFTYILKYLIIIIFIVDFGLRYNVLLEETKEHNLNVQYSPLCDTTKMGWSEYFVFLTGSRDCERRTVTPLDAFLFQIKNVIIVPMNAFGTGMGGFVANMYRTTPWGFGLFLLPVMLIFSLAIFIFLMAFMTDKAIEFNCFHLFKIKFGTPGSRENMLTGITTEQIFDRILHRPMVQDYGAAGDTGAINQLEGPTQGRREEGVEPKAIQEKSKTSHENNLGTEQNPEIPHNIGESNTQVFTSKIGTNVAVIDHNNQDLTEDLVLSHIDTKSPKNIGAKNIPDQLSGIKEKEDKNENCTKGTQTQFIKYN